MTKISLLKQARTDLLKAARTAPGCEDYPTFLLRREDKSKPSIINRIDYLVWRSIIEITPDLLSLMVLHAREAKALKGVDPGPINTLDRRINSGFKYLDPN